MRRRSEEDGREWWKQQSHSETRVRTGERLRLHRAAKPLPRLLSQTSDLDDLPRGERIANVPGLSVDHNAAQGNLFLMSARASESHSH